MLTPTDLQRQTLRLYAELLSRLPHTGRFVFTHGPQSSATGLPAAVSIAGGTSLTLDPDAATVKSVLRSGGLDFVVTNLDEALRVLKNEIRKHTPLSVAIAADPAPVLAEMQERGVQPDLQLHFGSLAGATPSVALQSVLLETESGLARPSDTAAAWLAARHWSEHHFTAATTSGLRAIDVRIIQLLSTAESSRLHWLRRIPHYQRPDPAAGRFVWLTHAEAANFPNL